MAGRLEGGKDCGHKIAVEVERMLAEGVNVNARNIGGWPGVSAAMSSNHAVTVQLLLSCSTIRLDSTDSVWTGLQYCFYKNSVRIFLAHPACTRQMVTMQDKVGKTAEMLADMLGYQECARLVREYSQ